MRNILITGCAGFIGSVVTQSILDSGSCNMIVGVDSFDNYYSKKTKRNNISDLRNYSNFKFFEYNILNTNDLRKLKYDFDICIHLAAKPGVISSVNIPNQYFENNLIGTSILLDFLKSRNVKKIIFASSSSVYDSDNSNSFSEDKSMLSPLSPYGLSKLFCESYLDMFHRQEGFDVIKLRLFSVYGPKMRPDLAIYKFTKSIIEGDEISVFGSGNSARDYTYIADVADAFISTIDYILTNNKVCEAINIGNSKPISITKLISLLSNKLKIKVNKQYLPSNDFELDFTHADLTKAKKLIGYNPKIEIDKGLDNFIKWYKCNIM